MSTARFTISGIHPVRGMILREDSLPGITLDGDIPRIENRAVVGGNVAASIDVQVVIDVKSITRTVAAVWLARHLLRSRRNVNLSVDGNRVAIDAHEIAEHIGQQTGADKDDSDN